MCNARYMSQAPVAVPFLEFDLADRMRKSLRYSGAGVQEMADYLGVARTSVSNWINGRVHPDRRTRIAWALRTGVSVQWLETGQAPDVPGPDDGCATRDSNPEPAGLADPVVRGPWLDRALRVEAA